MQDQVGQWGRPWGAQNLPHPLLRGRGETHRPGQVPAARETEAPGGRLRGRAWTKFPPSHGAPAAQALLLPIQNQVREKRLLFPAGVSVSPGEGLRRSLQTERARPVGTMPHSLGGPAAAKITDKLTYKASFYFTSKPQRLPAEPPAGEQSPHRVRHRSFAGNRVPEMPRRKGEGTRRVRTPAGGASLDRRKPGPCPKALDRCHRQGPAAR